MSTESTADNESRAVLVRQLTLAIKASEELLLLAQAARWQDFERQFRQRDTLLHRIDAEVTRHLPLPDSEARLIGARLQQLRTINDELLSVAEVSKNAAAQDLAKDRSARKALNAYKKP